MDTYKYKYSKYKKKYTSIKNQLGHGKNKEIYLMRHGQTEWNKLGRGQGSEADIPLNELGKKQATITGQYLKKYRLQKQFDCIFSSPMSRAKETAEIIKNIIEFDKEIEYDDMLKELKNGKLSGLYKTDPLFKKMKEYENKIQSIDPIEKYANKYEIERRINEHFSLEFELDDEVQKRMDIFIQKVIKSDCNKILVVAHGDCLLSLIRHLFKLSIDPVGNFDNGANCWISYITYNEKDGFKLLSPSNTEHLSLNI